MRHRDLTQHIIHTLVKATAFESVCHFRTQVSVIATHFLQAVFSTVHYMISLCQIPFAVHKLWKLKYGKSCLTVVSHARIISTFHQITDRSICFIPREHINQNGVYHDFIIIKTFHPEPYRL